MGFNLQMGNVRTFLSWQEDGQLRTDFVVASIRVHCYGGQEVKNKSIVVRFSLVLVLQLLHPGEVSIVGSVLDDRNAVVTCTTANN